MPGSADSSARRRMLATLINTTRQSPHSRTTLRELKDLTSDNPEQQARWIEIKRLTDERILSALQRSVDLRTNLGSRSRLSRPALN